MVSDGEISSAKTFIFLVVGVMSGWYVGETGGKAGKDFVYQISSLMDDTLIQQLLGLLFQRDFVVAIGAMVGTFVGCATPPAVVFFLSNGITKILEKWADEEARRQQKYAEKDEDNETEWNEDNETETIYNKNRSNKKKTNKKPKPNNKRQSNRTQNNEEKKEMERQKLLKMERQKLSQMIYELLGEKPDATMDEIQSRYRRMTLKYHPDKGGSYDDWHRLEKAMEIIKEERNIAT